MASENAEASILKALDELNFAFKACTAKNIEEAKLRVYYASSETEYALFLMKTRRNNDFDKNLSPTKMEDEKADMLEYIVEAQSLLQEALKLYREQNFSQAYDEMWKARLRLASLQEKIERNLI